MNNKHKYEKLIMSSTLARKDALYKEFLTVKNEIELAKPLESLSSIPVFDMEIYRMYQEHEKMHWNEFEHNFMKDRESYDALNDKEKSVIDGVFAYFLVTDGAVSGNLEERFKEDCVDYQSKSYLISQDHRELTHANGYGLSISVLKRGDISEIIKLVKNMRDSEPISKKINFLRKVCFNPDTPIWELYFYAACTEGIHFSALFCIVFYLNRHLKIMTEFGAMNEQISREETSHRDFNLLKFLRHVRDILNKIEDPIDRKKEEERIKERCYEITREAIEIEDSFVDHILDVPFKTMTKDHLKNYARLMADQLLYHAVLTQPMYGVKNNCVWTEEINTDQKTNFYDMLVTAYRKGSTQISDWETYVKSEYKEEYNIQEDEYDF